MMSFCQFFLKQATSCKKSLFSNTREQACASILPSLKARMFPAPFCLFTHKAKCTSKLEHHLTHSTVVIDVDQRNAIGCFVWCGKVSETSFLFQFVEHNFATGMIFDVQVSHSFFKVWLLTTAPQPGKNKSKHNCGVPVCCGLSDIGHSKMERMSLRLFKSSRIGKLACVFHRGKGNSLSDFEWQDRQSN